MTALKKANAAATPLALKPDAGSWWAPFYVAGSIKATERKLFAR